MTTGVAREDSGRSGAEGKDGLLSGQPPSDSEDAAMREDSPLVTFGDETSPLPAHHPSYSWRHASMIIVGEVLAELRVDRIRLATRYGGRKLRRACDGGDGLGELHDACPPRVSLKLTPPEMI